jgi:hypothetical protein
VKGSIRAGHASVRRGLKPYFKDMGMNYRLIKTLKDLAKL